MFDFIDIIVKGGAVMAPLLACSIIALTVVIERWLFWRRIGSRHLAESLLDLVERGELNKAAESARQTDSPLVRVMISGLTHPNAMTKALEVAAQKEIPVLKQRLTILDTIITLAPLLGLLGTVTGMIGSFGIMSQEGIGPTPSRHRRRRRSADRHRQRFVDRDPDPGALQLFFQSRRA
jgi:biopolymer transport protein ExbB